MGQISDLVRVVTNIYIERGYVTTRAIVPVHDLGSPQLEIRIINGEVESIRNEDSSQDRRRRVAMAFPGPGRAILHEQPGLGILLGNQQKFLKQVNTP